MKIDKKKIAKIATFAGIVALAWLLDVNGIRTGVKENPAPEAPSQVQVAQTARAEPSGVVRDGEYDGKAEVAEYIRKYGGRLPRNYITKAQARALGWQGGPLEPYAPGKSIGGDHFGNYESKLPDARYRECDIETRGKPRGSKRLIYTQDGHAIYYTADHYGTFEEVEVPSR